MRTLRAFVITLMLGILPAIVGQAPVASHAAPAAARTFTATLVSAPQSLDLSQPVNMLVQSGGRTILVQVSGKTQLVSRNYASITLADLRDGHRLQISGTFNGIQIFAFWIRDLSINTGVILHITGQLSPPQPGVSPTPLCVANAAFSNTSKPRSNAQTVSPCQAVAGDPSPLPLYVTASTKIRNASGGAAALGDLKVGDTVEATASFDGSQFVPLVVKDTSLQSSVVVISGILMVTSQATDFSQPVNLLVQSGNHPILVQVTGTTQLLDRNYAPITLANLHHGDLVNVTGSFSGVQLIASKIRDLSVPVVTVQVQGTLAAQPNTTVGLLCLQMTFTTGIRSDQVTPQSASPCPSGQTPIYFTAGTQFLNASAGSLGVGDLQVGDTLKVTGNLQGSFQFVATLVTDTSR